MISHLIPQDAWSAMQKEPAINTEALESWLESCKHLPPFLRDFHDQKDVFKFMDKVVCNATKKDTTHPARMVNWTAAHVYVIDIFLWIMAKHGYTLQRTKKNLEFYDIHETLEEDRKERRRLLEAALPWKSRLCEHY